LCVCSYLVIRRHSTDQYDGVVESAAFTRLECGGGGEQPALALHFCIEPLSCSPTHEELTKSTRLLVEGRGNQQSKRLSILSASNKKGRRAEGNTEEGGVQRRSSSSSILPFHLTGCQVASGRNHGPWRSDMRPGLLRVPEKHLGGTYYIIIPVRSDVSGSAV